MNKPNDKVFYDAHAKNVIVECKDGRTLEDLIASGDLTGSYDPTRMIQILFMSTVDNLETINDEIYTYKKIGKMDCVLNNANIAFYLYFRNVGKSETLPSGTVVVAEFNSVATISTLGGYWELLGEMILDIDDVEKTFFAYKKI